MESLGWSSSLHEKLKAYLVSRNTKSFFKGEGMRSKNSPVVVIHAAITNLFTVSIAVAISPKQSLPANRSIGSVHKTRSPGVIAN